MKLLIAFVVGITLTQQPLAQKKEATPDKAATIEFLNKKTKEIIGYPKLGVSQKVFINKKIITDGHIKFTATGIEMLVAYKSDEYTFSTYASFNPKHIIAITNTSATAVSADSPVGTLEIKFIGKTVLYNNNGNISNVDKATLHYMQVDPENETQIKKALLHLKAIYKEEDTLF